MTSKKGPTLSGLQERIQTAEYYKPPTKRTPEVLLDIKKGLIFISGRSLPVRPNDFYFPFLRKIEEYIENPASSTTVIFNLEYVDSASSKLILATVMRLKKIQKKEELNFQWYYTEDDHDIFELGKTFAELSGCEFELKEFD